MHGLPRHRAAQDEHEFAVGVLLVRVIEVVIPVSQETRDA
jgi:hypothetical protein